MAMAKEAGFDVSKVDWLGYQARQTLEMSDDELERVAGGTCMNTIVPTVGEHLQVLQLQRPIYP